MSKNLPGVPKTHIRRLIWCKLKTTILTQSAFIFSESSYLNLKFGIMQSKIGWKFAEQWLPKLRTGLWTDNQIFRKMHRFKAAILLHLSSMELKNFMKLKKTQLFYLVIKLIKPSLYHGLVRDEKLREASVSYFLVRRITLMLSRISSEPLMSLGNKHNYKTFPKSPPASLLHCIGNIWVVRLGSGVIL